MFGGRTKSQLRGGGSLCLQEKSFLFIQQSLKFWRYCVKVKGKPHIYTIEFLPLRRNTVNMNKKQSRRKKITTIPKQFCFNFLNLFPKLSWHHGRAQQRHDFWEKALTLVRMLICPITCSSTQHALVLLLSTTERIHLLSRLITRCVGL